jgi:cytochrome c oxidase assembly factor CtaG
MHHPMTMGDPLAPLTWTRALTTWRFSPITVALLALVLLLYLAAVAAARRNGTRWPLVRERIAEGVLRNV